MAGQRKRVLGLCPITTVAEHGIDGMPAGDLAAPGDVSAHRGHDAGEVTAGNRHGTWRASRGLVGDIPRQLSNDDARRRHAHEHVSRAGMRLGHLLIDEMVRSTAPMDANRFHPVVLPMLCTPGSYSSD